jgi:hypothetical protein
MGLDMFAFSTTPETIGDQLIDISPLDEKGEVHEIAYWRKFNALHGWMEDLYVHRGGAGDFNCVKIRLLPEDIDRLESEMNTLRPRNGFFFGSQDIYPEDIETLKSFIAKAREEFADGRVVMYDSWW